MSLYVGETKNREARTIFLPELLLELLQAQKERQERDYPECQYVFDRHGEQIRNFRYRWLQARKVTGLSERILHDFRRTAVRNMVRAGVPERVAMAVTGHKTRGVFERYNIVSTGDLREAAKKMASEDKSGRNVVPIAARIKRAS
jgi:integrase